jgi:hypothetical protein
MMNPFRSQAIALQQYFGSPLEICNLLDDIQNSYFSSLHRYIDPKTAENSTLMNMITILKHYPRLIITSGEKPSKLTRGEFTRVQATQSKARNSRV